MTRYLRPAAEIPAATGAQREVAVRGIFAEALVADVRPMLSFGIGRSAVPTWRAREMICREFLTRFGAGILRRENTLDALERILHYTHNHANL